VRRSESRVRNSALSRQRFAESSDRLFPYSESGPRPKPDPSSDLRPAHSRLPHRQGSSARGDCGGDPFHDFLGRGPKKARQPQTPSVLRPFGATPDSDPAPNIPDRRGPSQAECFSHRHGLTAHDPDAILPRVTPGAFTLKSFIINNLRNTTARGANGRAVPDREQPATSVRHAAASRKSRVEAPRNGLVRPGLSSREIGFGIACRARRNRATGAQCGS